jgi:hypothetical protein
MSIFSKEESEPKPTEILGRPLICTICGHDQFRSRKAQLPTGLGAAFNAGWAEPPPVLYVFGSLVEPGWSF